MPRSKAPSLLLLAVFGLGCEAARQRVYVDMDAVLAGYKLAPLAQRPLPKPPGGAPAATLSVPAVSARTVVVQGGSEAAANAALEHNRQEAVRQLTRILAKRYTRVAEAEGAELVRGLQPLRERSMEAARDRVLAAFRAYADKRGIRVAQLTSIVGFPDPNPESLPPTQSLPEFARLRLQEASKLRGEIRALDSEYAARLDEILASVGREYDVNLTDVRLEIERRRIAGLDRAEREAMEEAASTYRSLVPLLMGSTEMRIAAQPATSVTLPAIPAPASAPDVRQQSLTSEQRRAILQSQLNIWAGLRSYQVSPSPRGARDATLEFVRWRMEQDL